MTDTKITAAHNRLSAMRAELDAKVQIVQAIESLDLSLIRNVYIGFDVHLDIVGTNDYKAFVQQLHALNASPQTTIECDNGEVHHKWDIPGVTSGAVQLSLDILPDTATCQLVKVDERITEIYRVKCD